MNNKNIIIAGAIAIGLYLFSQVKKIPFTGGAQKTERRSPPATTPTVRQRTAQKIAQKIAQKVAQKRIGQPTTQAARIAAARRAAARRAAARRAAVQRAAARRAAVQRAAVQRAAAQRAAVQRAAAQRAAARRAAAQRAAARRAAVQRAAVQRAAAQRAAAQKVAQKKVASWKAPYRFPNTKFRVITPSDILKNLAKKGIARKKALPQKKVQKTTPSTPSDRRKSRLKALYGSHWHDIWLKRQKRR